MSDENRIGLAEMIENLRQELLDSQKMVEDSDITEQTIKLSLKAQDYSELDENGEPRYVNARG